MVTTPGSIIQSPHYPRNYESGKDCRVTITFSSWIMLRVLDFDIEAANRKHCEYDYLNIYDGPDDSSGQIGTKLCGKTSPIDINSTGNAMHILFHTNGQVEKAGFRMKILQIGRCISIRKTLWIKILEQSVFRKDSKLWSFLFRYVHLLHSRCWNNRQKPNGMFQW